MRHPISALVLTAALALGACQARPADDHGVSLAPKPVAFPASEQPVLVSTHHWQEVAATTADTLRRALPRYGAQVGVTTGPSPFEAGFGRLLATALTERGIWVAEGGSPWTVRVTGQEVVHPDTRLFALNELLVSAQLFHGGVQVAGKEATFYLSRAEQWNYQLPPPPAPAETAPKPVYSARF